MFTLGVHVWYMAIHIGHPGVLGGHESNVEVGAERLK